VSIGESLAEARRQAGLTVYDVSQRTRIRESIIRRIEQDDFSASGGDFYARGHIRGIASAVGIDPAPLIMEYDTEHGPLAPIRAADVFEPSTPLKIRERRRSPSLSMIVAVVLLAIIGFSAYHLVASRNTGSRHVAAGQSPARSTPAARAVSPTPTPSASYNGVVIQLTAVEACWVQLTRSSDGSQIYMGTIPAGQSMTWRVKHAVQMTLGNPGGIVLTVDGKRQAPDTTKPVTLSFSPTQSG
jgi:cytoskeletal protein RodZ